MLLLNFEYIFNIKYAHLFYTFFNYNMVSKNIFPNIESLWNEKFKRQNSNLQHQILKIFSQHKNFPNWFPKSKIVLNSFQMKNYQKLWTNYKTQHCTSHLICFE